MPCTLCQHLAGRTILSLREIQEVGVGATCGLYGMCAMLAPQIPGSGSLHYIQQVRLEIAPLFTPLVDFSTLVGEMHAAEEPGGSGFRKEY